MEEDDVDDVRRDDRQGQRYEAIREEQRAADHLDALDEREHVAGRGQRAHECHGLFGRRGRRKELQEAVQAEYEEDQTEEEPGRRSSKTGDRVHGCLPFSWFTEMSDVFQVAS